uniref:Carboxypeptidase B-like n=1 Tax=Haliotis discus discus TaxID=91233 RepID=A0A7I6IQ92_HALDI|nr:carboxypeptidase B-like [Haliotis discus discus]
MFRSGVLLLLAGWTCVHAVVRYDGHQVLRVVPKTLAEYRRVQKLEAFGAKAHADIWRSSNGVGRPFDFRVTPEDFNTMTMWLHFYGLQYEVMVKDVEVAAQKQRQSNNKSTSAIDFDYGKYHDFDEVNQWITDIAAEYPNLVSVITASQTYEGRNVRGLKISVSNATKPSLWYQGGIHAREWISPATVIYITAQLLQQYPTRPEVKEILEGFDIYVVPVLNADGYAYTWTGDRLWRKTRTQHGICKGVDPNRNYGFQWGESSGSSGDPCSETYRGPSAFSEPVIKGVTDFIKDSGVTFKGFIDFHSYSEVWMTAWGYTTDTPNDFDAQDASSAAATAAIKAVHGTTYEHGTIASVLYIANGNSVDWAYGSMGIKYAATPELRDKGQFGFLLPADQIIPCGEETLEGFLAYAKYVLDN